MRRTIILLAACCAVLTAAVTPLAAEAPRRTVPCAEIIDTTRFPFVGSADRRYRSRLVLGAVSAPPVHIPQTSPTGSKPWTQFSKWGMVVQASGKAVTITVPPAWRQRVGISWGNAGHGVFSSIRIAGCGSDPTRGNAYAGGFFLRRPGACVPLVFQVGDRRQMVWFGVAKRC